MFNNDESATGAGITSQYLMNSGSWQCITPEKHEANMPVLTPKPIFLKGFEY